jgi:hypothetical protein
MDQKIYILYTIQYVGGVGVISQFFYDEYLKKLVNNYEINF